MREHSHSLPERENTRETSPKLDFNLDLESAAILVVVAVLVSSASLQEWARAIVGGRSDFHSEITWGDRRMMMDISSCQEKPHLEYTWTLAGDFQRALQSLLRPKERNTVCVWNCELFLTPGEIAQETKVTGLCLVPLMVFFWSHSIHALSLPPSPWLCPKLLGCLCYWVMEPVFWSTGTS